MSHGKLLIILVVLLVLIVIPEILAALAFGTVMENFLTNESALVQLLGGDNRLTALVIRGISLAAVLCTLVTDPAAAPNSSPTHGRAGRPAESSV